MNKEITVKIARTGIICGILFCAPAMAQKTPQQAAAQQSSQSGASAQAAAAPRVLTLDEAVTLALQHSPQLALARVQYNVAKNTAGVARAEFRPNLYTGSGAAYTNGFPTTPGGGPPAVFQMSYTQAIFDKEKSGELHADEELAKNKQLEYENQRGTVIAQAAATYLELADVQKSLALLQSAYDSAQRIVELAKQREAAGLELPVDVTQDELQSAKLSQELLLYQGRQDALSEQIRDMAGIPASIPLQVSVEELPGSESMDFASNIVAEAVDHSAAIREAENYRRAREELLRGAKGAYWPTLSLIGEYSILSKINNYEDFFQKGSFQRHNVTAGISVVIPIFAARTSANVALAKSNLDEASLDLLEAKRSVREGAEQQVRTLKEADAAKEVARLDLQLAQEQLQNAQSDFNQGRATLAQLEQAHVLENQKWLAFLDADLGREKAQLDLLKATGQLAQVFHQKQQ
ncbi:MAG TPA: TolC family protein [Candidatus Acidoferrales bacterium]|nr:TolC family protein [Candidatus Acidoferrales bacterium]